MSLKDQEAENQFLNENLAKGYIVPSESPYGFSTFMVPKKDSKENCYIINYCPLNAVTKKDVTRGLLEPQPPPGTVFPWLKTGARRGIAHRYKSPPMQPL